MADYGSVVEDFAALCAKLDHPFGDRARLLAEVGLDEPSYAVLLGEWRRRLAAEENPVKGLGRRFAEAYRNAVDPAQRLPSFRPGNPVRGARCPTADARPR